jgi:iron complex outermembrane receptor protein
VPAAVGNVAVTRDVSGYTAARSPTFSGNVGGNYTIHLPQGNDLKWTTNLYHTNGFAFNADHSATQGGYNTLELSATLTPDSHAWGVTVWANNLTGTYYFTYKTNNNYGLYGIPGAPRTFGIDASYYFGKTN